MFWNNFIFNKTLFMMFCNNFIFNKTMFMLACVVCINNERCNIVRLHYGHVIFNHFMGKGSTRMS